MSGKFPSEDYRYGLMEAVLLLYIHLHLSVRGRPLLVLEVMDLLRVGYAMVTAAGPTPIRGGLVEAQAKGNSIIPLYRVIIGQGRNSGKRLLIKKQSLDSNISSLYCLQV